MVEFPSVNSKEEARKIMNGAVTRSRHAKERARKNPLDKLPRTEPRPLGLEGLRLKAELEHLIAAQLELTREERSQQRFDRLMAARHASPSLPLTHAHPFLDATIEVVQRIRANRLSAEPKSPEELGVDLILAGEEDAFSALSDLKKWDSDQRINLLEKAETVLARTLSGKA